MPLVQILGKGDDEWSAQVDDGDLEEFLADLQSDEPFIEFAGNVRTFINKEHIVSVLVRE